LNITCHNQRNKTEAENSWTLQQAAEYNHNQKQHIKASQEETNLQLFPTVTYKLLQIAATNQSLEPTAQKSRRVNS
jgi:hypothetical protein